MNGIYENSDSIPEAIWDYVDAWDEKLSNNNEETTNNIIMDYELKRICKQINECYSLLNYGRLGEREYATISAKFSNLQKQYMKLTNEEISVI
jgi:hypothetical protein